MTQTSNKFFETDIAIIGAGPAGCAASLSLSQAGIPHLIFDKAIFPRDKICGDALSGKIVVAFRKINPTLISALAADKKTVLDSWGLSFISPNGNRVDIRYAKSKSEMSHPPGFIVKRFDFDHFLVKQVQSAGAQFMSGAEVTDIINETDGLLLKFKPGSPIQQCKAKLIIGAEGDRSIVAKKLGGFGLDPAHYFAGLRVYYRGVTGLHPENFVELHFLKELLPGYFWIFPMTDGSANVGIAMLSQTVRQKNIALKTMLDKIIFSHPAISPRFKQAQAMGEVKGWGLPLASARRHLSGERYLLVGDAGSLIDPFTGEGIGNAMASGILAAEVTREALKEKNYSRDFLSRYNDGLYRRIGSELKVSQTIQRLLKFPKLINFVIGRAAHSKELQHLLSCMLSEADIRIKFRSPMFYLKLLFNR